MTCTTTEEIRREVRRKYAEAARSMVGKFSYATSGGGASAVGYQSSALSDLPADILETFCGVGNPLALGPVHAGERVLDVGCGAGVDMILASRLVGPSGSVCGIDLTPEMVEKARANFARVGAGNASASAASSEEIPYEQNSFDVVISNGVLNLSPLKEQSLREIF
jgi:2-polyprenyl-3-methyl-5-hydroxy-6-metoxy-1,4-benzoquinol methylase